MIVPEAAVATAADKVATAEVKEDMVAVKVVSLSFLRSQLAFVNQLLTHRLRLWRSTRWRLWWWTRRIRWRWWWPLVNALPDVVRTLCESRSMTSGHTGSSVIRGWLCIIF